MFEYRIDILQALKAAGYNTSRLRREKLIGESSLTLIRRGKIVKIETLDTVCDILGCQLEDILIHKKNTDSGVKTVDNTPRMV